MSVVRRRESSRVVLLDPRDRLLLLRVVDDGEIVIGGRPSPRTYWITPGGGREPGESFEDNARREVREETGLDGFRLGPHLWDREADLTFFGEDVHAVERYYAGWSDVTEVSFAGHEPHEQTGIVEHRWWTRAELDADAAPVWFPENLLDLYAEAVRLRPA
jgi:8-oxo-dGTP diphosphatase